MVSSYIIADPVFVFSSGWGVPPAPTCLNKHPHNAERIRSSRKQPETAGKQKHPGSAAKCINCHGMTNNSFNLFVKRKFSEEKHPFESEKARIYAVFRTCLLF